MAWALLGIGAVPILVTCGIAIGFAIYKPEKLQSDDYQIRQQSLQMLQGRDGPEIIDAVTVIANPSLPPGPQAALPEGDVP